MHIQPCLLSLHDVEDVRFIVRAGINDNLEATAYEPVEWVLTMKYLSYFDFDGKRRMGYI